MTWWVAVPIAVLLVAAIVVAAVALRRAPIEATGPAPTETTSPMPQSPAASPTSGTVVADSAPATTPPPSSASSAPSTTTTPTAPVQPPRTTTTVTIATAGWRDGAAAVSGYAAVVEDGGTCTVTLTRGSVTVTGSRAATADATTTSCGVVEVRDARLTAGTWRVVLSYDSPASAGASDPTTLTIG